MSAALTLDRARLSAFRARFPAGLFAFVSVRSTVPESGAKSAAGAGASSPSQLHETLVRGTLSQFKEADEIGRAGESVHLIFTKPDDAVKFSTLLRSNLQALTQDTGQTVVDQIGIHAVELAAQEDAPFDEEIYLRPLGVCLRLTEMARASQILMTGGAFDTARQTFKREGLPKEDLLKIAQLAWMNHGPYSLTGFESELEICEIAFAGKESGAPPPDSDLARRLRKDNDQVVWGWRPALGQLVPGTNLVLDERCADGRFGEVWGAKEEKTKTRRMFQLCFRKDWVALLKEQENVFELLRKKVGENRNVARIQAFSFEQPPFYVMTDFLEGTDLKTWCQERGGLAGIPLTSRLEIIAQVASGLHAAHEAGIVHRFMKPAHIIVAGTGATPKDIHAMLTNFSIGHVGIKDEEPAPESSAAVSPAPTIATLPTVAPVPPPKASAPPDAKSAKPEVKGAKPEVKSDKSEAKSGTPAPPTTDSSSASPPPPETPPPPPDKLYHAPELLAGGGPTAKADIYALGVILCQFLLADFTAALAPARIKDISSGLKREKLPAYFMENPLERTTGAGGIAGDLRAVIKARETRVTELSKVTPQRLAWTLAALCILGCIGVIGYTHYSKQWRLASQTEGGRKKPKGEVKEIEESGDPASMLSEPVKVDDLVKPDADSEEDEEVSVRGKSGGKGGKKLHPPKKEVPSAGAQLFKYLVFPIIMVVILGSVIQNFGPQIAKMFKGNKPEAPPTDDS